MIKIPSKIDVHMLGTTHNPKVWEKHFEYVSDTKSKSALGRVLARCATTKNSHLSREFVFSIAEEDVREGLIASVIWGFPKGSGPGGNWKRLADAFAKSREYADAIEKLKRAPFVSALAGLCSLNQIQNGVGFATTSKMAYFANVEFQEGRALIYDRNVMLAIKDGLWADRFDGTRSGIGMNQHFYSKGVSTYASFIEEAEKACRQIGCDADQIETGLFLARANAKSNWTFS